MSIIGSILESRSNDIAKYAPSKPGKHLTRSEVNRIVSYCHDALSQFSKLKKCFDFTDLYSRDEYPDDDGQYTNKYMQYEKKKPNSFLELITGDVYAGYPDYDHGGESEYNDDLEDYIKAVNSMIKKGEIKAEFSHSSGNGISLGVTSKS